jgi:FMN phosphatase YigB (HAD superfamily)
MHLCLLAILLSSVSCAFHWLRHFHVKAPLFPKTLRPFKFGQRKFVMNLSALMPRNDKEWERQRFNIEWNYAINIFGKQNSAAVRALHRYGSIINGLVVEKGVDRVAFEEYMAANLDYEKITPNEKLPKLLDELDADIIVYTNLRPKYATKILEQLKLTPYINAIFTCVPEGTDLPLETLSAEEAFAQIKHTLNMDSEHIIHVDDLGKYLLENGFFWEKLAIANIHPYMIDYTVCSRNPEDWAESAAKLAKAWEASRDSYY